MATTAPIFQCDLCNVPATADFLCSDCQAKLDYAINQEFQGNLQPSFDILQQLNSGLQQAYDRFVNAIERPVGR